MRALCALLLLLATPAAAQSRAELEAQARQGVVPAQCALGRLLMAGSEKKLGLEYCRAGADAGDPTAAVEVGQAYLDGKLMPRNPAAAAGMFGRAADLRHGPGAYRLAELYLAGDGVAKDPEVALRWLRVAADGGEKRAPFRLGELNFAKGIRPATREVVEEPATQSAAWYMLAAELDPDNANRGRAREQLDLILGVAPQLKRRAEQLAQDYRRGLPPA